LRKDDSEKINPATVGKFVTDKGLELFLPTAVQKSYFMLSDAERDVLNRALEKYGPGQSEPILVGGNKVLKPALRFMTYYRLKIDEIMGGPGLLRVTHGGSMPCK
jgi:hypothetical protein